MRSLNTMHKSCHLIGESFLSLTFIRFRFNLMLVFANLGTSQESKDLQTVHHISISGIKPELVEGIGWAHLRIQPNCVAFALTKLRAIGIGNQRSSNSVNGFTLNLTNQLSTACEITPLIRATGLQGTPVLTIKLKVIQPLQNLVWKLGVRNTLFWVQAFSNDFLLHHSSHAEMLTNITQEINSGKLPAPVQVIHHPGAVLSLKREKPLNLGTQRINPPSNNLTGIKHTLWRLTRITNQSRKTTHQTNRLMPGKLQTTHHQ